MARLHEVIRFIRDYVVPDVRSNMFWIGIVISAVIAKILDLKLWEVAVIYVLILVHEIGHTLAFYCLGYKPKRIHLNLVFGTAGSHQLPRSQEDLFIIVLAGPLAGFLFAIVTGFLFYLTRNEVFAYATFLGIVVNGLNLVIPIFPLDGGHLFSAVSSSVHKKGGFIISAVIILIGMALALRQEMTLKDHPILWGMALFGLVQVFMFLTDEEPVPAPMKRRTALMAAVSHLGLAAMMLVFLYGSAFLDEKFLDYLIEGKYSHSYEERLQTEITIFEVEDDFRSSQDVKPSADLRSTPVTRENERIESELGGDQGEQTQHEQQAVEIIIDS